MTFPRVTSETIAVWRTYCESKVAIKKDGLPSVSVLLVNCQEFLDLLADLDDARKRIAELDVGYEKAASVISNSHSRICGLEAKNASLKEDLSVARSSLYKVVEQRNQTLKTASTLEADLAKTREEIERLQELCGGQSA